MIDKILFLGLPLVITFVQNKEIYIDWAVDFYILPKMGNFGTKIISAILHYQAWTNLHHRARIFGRTILKPGSIEKQPETLLFVLYYLKRTCVFHF